MRTCALFALFLMLSAACGCGITIDTKTVFNDLGLPEPEERYYNATPNQVFEAIVKVTRSNNFEPEVENRRDGLIITGFMKSLEEMKSYELEVAETFLSKCVATVERVDKISVRMRLVVAEFRSQGGRAVPTGCRNAPMQQSIMYEIEEELPEQD